VVREKKKKGPSIPHGASRAEKQGGEGKGVAQNPEKQKKKKRGGSKKEKRAIAEGGTFGIVGVCRQGKKKGTMRRGAKRRSL